MYSITMKYWPVLLVAAGVEHLDDVRVHQARGRLRLALEARHERGVVGEVLGQQLDRHLALEAHVEREVHRRHAAEARAGPRAGSARRSHVGIARSFRRLPAPPAPRPTPRAAAGTLPLPSPAPVPPPCPPAPDGVSPAPGAGVPPPEPGVVGVVVVGVVGVVAVGVVGVVGVCGRRGGGGLPGWSSAWWPSPAPAAGCTARARANAGWRCPGATVVAQAGVDARGERGEVLFGLQRSPLRWPCSFRCPLPRPARLLRSRSAAAALARRGSALPSCRRRPAAQRRTEQPRRHDAAAGQREPAGERLGCDASSLTVLQALGERVRQARGADRGGGAGDVVVGAVEGRGHRVECRAAARTRAGRRRAAGRRCRGSAATRPRPGPAVRRRGAARRSPARPRGARTTAPRASGRSGRCAVGWTSRQSSASSAESTYSHTGSRGLAW